MHPDCPITLERTTAPPLSCVKRKIPGHKLLIPPNRLPSFFPAPGKLDLTLHLGERIGGGRSGSVYKVDVLVGTAVESFKIPPLVIKIARPIWNDDFMNEVGSYDEMKCLQGSSIPRCYGYFMGRSPLPVPLLREALKKDVEKESLRKAEVGRHSATRWEKVHYRLMRCTGKSMKKPSNGGILPNRIGMFESFSSRDLRRGYHWEFPS
ncbi:hypothetical protein PM082_015464 [Marasmius tenuissimus]|nr:hypothetical protein PM082_015464 [Marasmius tenuissimus]